MSEIRQYKVVIGDDNWLDYKQAPVVDGRQKGFGLLPRDYTAVPPGTFAALKPWDAPLIPMQEWPERIREKEARKMRLSDIRRVSGPNGGIIPSLDQGNSNYCWAHSPITAGQLARAVAGMTYIELSAFAGACMIKNYQNNGGWSPEAVQFACNRGVPSVRYWPRGSWSRSNDNAATWQDAANYRFTDVFMELAPPVYDRDLTIQQQGTSLLNNWPIPGDHNFWSHSIGHMDLLDVYPDRHWSEPTRYGSLILNSWGNGWGNQGEGVLKDNRWITDGASCVKGLIGT